MKKIFAEIAKLEKLAKEEGPRGGVILGRTSSGKPIYDSHDHPEHKDFKTRDHIDAMHMHDDLADKHWGSSNLPGNQNKEMFEKHRDQAKGHAQASKAKQHLG